MQAHKLCSSPAHAAGHVRTSLAVLRPARWQKPLQAPLRAKADEPKEKSSGQDSFSVSFDLGAAVPGSPDQNSCT